MVPKIHSCYSTLQHASHAAPPAPHRLNIIIIKPLALISIKLIWLSMNFSINQKQKFRDPYFKQLLYQYNVFIWTFMFILFIRKDERAKPGKFLTKFTDLIQFTDLMFRKQNLKVHQRILRASRHLSASQPLHHRHVLPPPEHKTLPKPILHKSFVRTFGEV